MSVRVGCSYVSVLDAHRILARKALVFRNWKLIARSMRLDYMRPILELEQHKQELLKATRLNREAEARPRPPPPASVSLALSVLCLFSRRA